MLYISFTDFPQKFVTFSLSFSFRMLACNVCVSLSLTFFFFFFSITHAFYKRMQHISLPSTGIYHNLPHFHYLAQFLHLSRFLHLAHLFCEVHTCRLFLISTQISQFPLPLSLPDFACVEDLRASSSPTYYLQPDRPIKTKLPLFLHLFLLSFAFVGNNFLCELPWR